MNPRTLFALSGLVALVIAPAAYASQITGTLSAGSGSSVTGTVIGIPTADPAPGSYASAQSVSLSSPGSSSIRYSTDGSTPNCSGGGNLYTAPISVSSNTTILAVSCYSSGASSSVGTYVYTISGGGLTGTVATSSGGTLSGTVTSSPGGTLTGTVSSPSSSGGGGGGGGSNGPPAGSIGGGGGGGSIIPTTTTTPPGQVLGATTGPTTPGVPNTGAGGRAGENTLILVLSGLFVIGASALLLRGSLKK